MDLERELRDLLAGVHISARRFSLETREDSVSVPTLRGIWGATIKGLDSDAYEVVFRGAGPHHNRLVAYVLRTAPPEPGDDYGIEWITFQNALLYDAVLLPAWDIASGLGLGRERSRFRIRSMTLSLEMLAIAATCAGSKPMQSARSWL